METILSYLDNMFLNLPHTTEVLRAKEELASMMEDKYNELMAEGKRENEAVGIVISEFGNLEELAEELGLSSMMGQNQEYGMAAKHVSREEAEEYITMSAKTNKWIALGVALCIWSPILLLLCGGYDDIHPLTDTQIVCFGLVPLFIMIAVAVSIFIYHGMKMERFEYLKKENIQIDSYMEKMLRQMDEMEKPAETVKIIIGVVICILAVVPVIVVGSMVDNDFIAACSVVFLLVLISIGVALLIIGGSKRECVKVLLQEGDYTKGQKKSNKLIDVIAGVYWPIAAAIYLIWSFVSMQWGITWIVWPIAGVLFGVIAAVCAVISSAIEQTK